MMMDIKEFGEKIEKASNKVIATAILGCIKEIKALKQENAEIKERIARWGEKK